MKRQKKSSSYEIEKSEVYEGLYVVILVLEGTYHSYFDNIEFGTPGKIVSQNHFVSFSHLLDIEYSIEIASEIKGVDKRVVRLTRNNFAFLRCTKF